MAFCSGSPNPQKIQNSAPVPRLSSYYCYCYYAQCNTKRASWSSWFKDAISCPHFAFTERSGMAGFISKKPMIRHGGTGAMCKERSYSSVHPPQGWTPTAAMAILNLAHLELLGIGVYERFSNLIALPACLVKNDTTTPTTLKAQTALQSYCSELSPRLHLGQSHLLSWSSAWFRYCRFWHHHCHCQTVSLLIIHTFSVLRITIQKTALGHVSYLMLFAYGSYTANTILTTVPRTLLVVASCFNSCCCCCCCCC